MRNLKKALSLALALVMLLGMMMVGAGAAEINDIDSVKADNQEAVKVMNAIDIIKGDENGNFNPDGTLKRAEAAVIISKVLLTPAVVEKLSGTQSSFTDVADYEGGWAVPYVEACALPGIIAGNGDGTFDPAGNVTGLQFAKMLLVTIGFDPDSYNGKANWEMLVRQDAIKAKLDANDVAITSGYLSRADAAQMAFNAITKYSPSNSNGYQVVGGEPETDVVFPSVLEAVLYQATQKEPGTLKTSIASDTLAVTRFSLKADTKTNELGLTVDTWKVGDDEVYASAKPVDATKTITKAAGTSGTNAAKMKGLGMEGFSVASDATYIENGASSDYFTADVEADPEADPAVEAEDNSAVRIGQLLAKTADNGTMYVYATNKVISKVVVVTNYIAKVANVVPGKDGKEDTVRIAAASFPANGYEKGDYVLYNLGKDKDGKTVVMNAVKADAVTGTMDKYTSAKKFTIDGVDYEISKLPGAPSVATLEAKVGKELTVYLDAAGKIAVIKDDAAAESNYLYVLGNSVSRSVTDYMSGNSYVVEITALTTTGEIVTYEIDKINNADVTSSVQVNDLRYTVRTLSEADGKMNLSDALTDIAGKAGSYIKAGATSITYGSPDKVALLNSATTFIFIEKDGSTYKGVTVQVGNANTGIDFAQGAAKVVVGADGAAKAVFVEAKYVDDSTSTGNVVYYAGGNNNPSVTTSRVDGKNQYVYTYTVYDINGEKMTLTHTTNTLGAPDSGAGIYYYNTDNTIGDRVDSAISGSGTVTRVSADTIEVTTDGPRAFLNVSAVVDAPASLCDDFTIAASQKVIYTVKASDPLVVENLWILSAAVGETIDGSAGNLGIVAGDSAAITGTVAGNLTVGEGAKVVITGTVTGNINISAKATVTIVGNNAKDITVPAEASLTIDGDNTGVITANSEKASVTVNGNAAGTINAKAAEATVTVKGNVEGTIDAATGTAEPKTKITIKGNIEEDAVVKVDPRTLVSVGGVFNAPVQVKYTGTNGTTNNTSKTMPEKAGILSTGGQKIMQYSADTNWTGMTNTSKVSKELNPIFIMWATTKKEGETVVTDNTAGGKVNATYGVIVTIAAGETVVYQETGKLGSAAINTTTLNTSEYSYKASGVTGLTPGETYTITVHALKTAVANGQSSAENAITSTEGLTLIIKGTYTMPAAE